MALEDLPWSNSKNNTIRLPKNNRTRPLLSKYRCLALNTAYPSRNILQHIHTKTDIKPRPKVARTSLLNHIFRQLLSAGFEVRSCREEDVTLLRGWEFGPCWEGELGGFDGADGFGRGGGGAVVQKAAVEGGVDWEGLGEDGFFAADLGWDSVEGRVGHGGLGCLA